MFFFLSKTVGWFASPINLVLALAIIGLLLLCLRRRRAGRAVLILSSLLMLLCGLTPFGNWMLIPLEQRFPVWDASRGKPDGIIVLGGSIAPDVSTARGIGVFPHAADRLVAAAELARRYPDIPVIFTGGSATLVIGDSREADFAANIFERLGLANDRVILERESRNTIENAMFVKAIAVPKPGARWLLITSAWHMPRSVGLFRGVGFPVEAYPVDWLTRGPADNAKFFDQPIRALDHTDKAAREWVGLTANYLSGKSKEFFPRPE